MCVIERKTYFHSNGRQRTVETTRPCPRAVGSRLCKNVERRSFEAARVVETRPSSSHGTTGEASIVAEGRDGRPKAYHPVSERSSGSSSVRRSYTTSERSPISTPTSSASSPSIVEVKPAGATSSSTSSPAPGYPPFMERTRAPYPPPDPNRIVTPEGTAIYDRPPSLEMPRAVDNERPRTSYGDERASYSRPSTRDGDPLKPSSSRPERRPSISVNTNVRPSFVSSGSSNSSGSNNLPRVGSLRRDSHRDSRPNERSRADSTRERRTPADNRGRQEPERSTRPGYDRLAEEASRQRHRQQTADALEGISSRDREQRSNRDREAQIEQNRQAGFDEMARERQRAEARRSADQQAADDRAFNDQLRRDAEFRAQNPSPSTRTSPNTTRRHRDSFTYNPTPMSPRAGPGYNVAVHQPQYPSPDAIRERGDDVIARERARGASDRLNTAMGGMNINDDYRYEVIDPAYGGEPSQESQRRRGGSGREKKPEQYWR